MGYPVVELVRDYEAGTGAASQARFLLTPGNTTRDTTANYTWCGVDISIMSVDISTVSRWVPLSLTTPALGFDTTSPSVWLDPATAATSTQVLRGIKGEGEEKHSD